MEWMVGSGAETVNAFFIGFIIGVIFEGIYLLIMPHINFIRKVGTVKEGLLSIPDDKMKKLEFFQRIGNLNYSGYAIDFAFHQPIGSNDLNADSSLPGHIRLNGRWTEAILNGEEEGEDFVVFVLSFLETLGHEAAHHEHDLTFKDLSHPRGSGGLIDRYKKFKLYNWVKEIHHDFCGFASIGVSSHDMIDKIIAAKVRNLDKKNSRKRKSKANPFQKPLLMKYHWWFQVKEHLGKKQRRLHCEAL